MRLDRAPGATLSIDVRDEAMPLAVGEQATLALRNVGRTQVEAAPLVFGGYGVVDPARGWDAYAGIDLRGRIVVVLANDPDFEAGADLGFEGRRMVLAGRVGSKFQAAAQAGDGCAHGNLADYQEELETLALDGSREAACFLSQMADWGLGRDKDPAQCWAWLRWAHERCPAAPEILVDGEEDDAESAFHFFPSVQSKEVLAAGDAWLAERVARHKAAARGKLEPKSGE